MIINSLFQTAQTQDVGRTQGQFQCARTALCNSVDVDMSTFANAYYLGWANPNNLPKAFWLSHCYETETEYIFECIEPSENFMIGFCSMSESVVAAGYRQYTGQSVETTALDSTRLINDLYPEFVGATATNYNIILHFIGFFSEPGALHVNNFNTTISTSTLASGSEKIDNYNQWLRYKNGEFKFKFNAPGQYGTYEIGYSDISSTGRIVTTTSTGVNATLYYKGFSLNGNRRYNGSATSGWNIMPFIVQQGSFEDTGVTGGKEFRAVRGSYYNNWAAYYQPLTGNLPGVLIPTSYGSFSTGYDNCVVKKEDIPMGGMNTGDFVDYTTMLLIRTSAYNYQFFPVGDINDIDAFFGLLPRLIRIPSSSDVSSYQEGLTYAPDVSANNEFLCQIKSGNISDENFKAGLRPWQYVDWEEYEEDPTQPQGIQKDEFIESEAPPYDPTPPTPAGEEGHNPDNPELSLGATEDVPGDSVEPDEHRDLPLQFPVSAFMTQYVLDANQIYNMGRTLWSGMGDSLSQMASNFVKTYTSTGTINIANLMDFFVSVKCFPFDMTDLNYGWQANAMTVGTGAVPILNESVWVLGVSTCTVDCGTVTTNIKPFTLGVNSNAYDFRNYVNCTISCFLPYCGTVELNPADVFPYTLSCKYFVDMLSGSCTAVIWSERPDGSVPVASKTGQIGKIVPISATNVMGVVGQAISGVSNIFQSVGEVVISAAKRRALGATQAPINEASKNKEYLQEMADYNKSQTDISNKYSDASSGLGVVTGAVNGIGNLMTRNGVGIPSLGAGVGLEALHISERPYIVIRRLNYSSPNNYAHTTGFATTDGGGENNKPTIGSYSGWTVFQNPDLTGIIATKEELDEIKMLLETGVYL